MISKLSDDYANPGWRYWRFPPNILTPESTTEGTLGPKEENLRLRYDSIVCAHLQLLKYATVFFYLVNPVHWGMQHLSDQKRYYECTYCRGECCPRRQRILFKPAHSEEKLPWSPQFVSSVTTVCIKFLSACLMVTSSQRKCRPGSVSAEQKVARNISLLPNSSYPSGRIRRIQTH